MLESTILTLLFAISRSLGQGRHPTHQMILPVSVVKIGE
jgi:hypothetical protein